MRVRLPLYSTVVITLCVLSACKPAQTQSLVKAVKEVQVTVTCSATSDSVWVKVDPWTAGVDRNTDLEWDLTAASNADTMTVTAKSPGNWPYDDAPPYGAKKGGKKAKASKMKSGAPKDVPYQYNIEVTCRNGAGPSHKLVIDPELIIVN
jgi:hypothetical protein